MDKHPAWMYATIVFAAATIYFYMEEQKILKSLKTSGAAPLEDFVKNKVSKVS